MYINFLMPCFSPCQTPEQYDTRSTGFICRSYPSSLSGMSTHVLACTELTPYRSKHSPWCWKSQETSYRFSGRGNCKQSNEHRFHTLALQKPPTPSWPLTGTANEPLVVFEGQTICIPCSLTEMSDKAPLTYSTFLQSLLYLIWHFYD